MAQVNNNNNSLKRSSTKEEFELVAGEVSVNVNSNPGAMVDIRGGYPVQLGDHTVVLAESQRTFRFICPVCNRTKDLSIEVWKRCPAEERRLAKEYAFGYFLDEPCDTPDNLNDLVKDATNPFIGQIASAENRRAIERKLKENLTNA